MRRKNGFASLSKQRAVSSDTGPSPRVDVLGVNVSAVDMAGAVAAIFGWIDRNEPNYVCVTGVHGVMESYRAPDLRGIHNSAGMVTPDGMPLAWLVRFAGHRASERVCGPELMPRLFAESQARGDRHYLYGGSQKALDLLQVRLLEIAPDAKIVGSCSPPYRALTEAEDRDIVADINASGADIVWVGLSTPKQERWMAAHRDRLRAPVLIGVGAAFDIHAGLVQRAPRFLRRTGFEWTYRLILEPKRLWWRYLSSNPLFLVLVALQKAGLYRPTGPRQHAS